MSTALSCYHQQQLVMLHPVQTSIYYLFTAHCCPALRYILFSTQAPRFGFIRVTQVSVSACFLLLMLRLLLYSLLGAEAILLVFSSMAIPCQVWGWVDWHWTGPKTCHKLTVQLYYSGTRPGLPNCECLPDSVCCKTPATWVSVCNCWRKSRPVFISTCCDKQQVTWENYQ